MVTPKQSSPPHHWLTPGYFKDKVKTSAVDEVLKYAVKIRLSKPFTFDSHTIDLLQHPLKLISAPQFKKLCSAGICTQVGN